MRNPALRGHKTTCPSGIILDPGYIVNYFWNGTLKVVAINHIHACQGAIKLFFIHKIRDSVNAQQRLSGPVPVLPIMEKTNAANAADGIGDHIHDVGLPGWDKILMDFIADSVKRGGSNTD